MIYIDKVGLDILKSNSQVKVEIKSGFDHGMKVK